MAEEARQPQLPGQRPPYLRPLAPARDARSEGSDLKDRLTERSIIAPSVNRSDLPGRPRALTASERRLVRWVEKYVPMKGDPDRLRAVQDERGNVLSGGTFYRAAPFVRRAGAALVLEALSEMFVFDENQDGGRAWRCWRSEIKSPARFLNRSVRDLVDEVLRKGAVR